MRLEGPIKNDTYLRALCSGLEVQMFGERGYDQFLDDTAFEYLPDPKDDVNIANEPDSSPKTPPNIKRKRKRGRLVMSSQGLVLSSQGRIPVQQLPKRSSLVHVKSSKPAEREARQDEPSDRNNALVLKNKAPAVSDSSSSTHTASPTFPLSSVTRPVVGASNPSSSRLTPSVHRSRPGYGRLVVELPTAASLKRR
ncbi:hypothetical protein FS749_002498 [Ceratobasidium sp. UAMH 11750]|nr:hypothetical protein FS749_002498 [Ceratobasidium sp. UAMH 11750]